jgi:phosphoserine phosphatase
MDAVEAVAEAWASMDGKLEEFQKGKTADSIESFGGHYAGYMSDADELVDRIKERGFILVPITGEVK